jgi:hypothetical protein
MMLPSHGLFATSCGAHDVAHLPVQYHRETIASSIVLMLCSWIRTTRWRILA